jgi:hypothetical protein
MTALLLPKPLQRILVTGPIHNKIEKLIDLQSNYDWIIVNGGLDYSNNWQLIKQLSKCIYVAGRNDLLLMTQTQNFEIVDWVRACYNVVVADFPDRTALVMDGGIPPEVQTRSQLVDNLELSFVSYLDNKPWQLSYNGGLGYVISNNPFTKNPPHYFNYSMQLGSLETDKVYAQEVDGIGLKATILL